MYFSQYVDTMVQDIIVSRFKKYRPIWKAWYFLTGYVSISDPEDVEVNIYYKLIIFFSHSNLRLHEYNNAVLNKKLHFCLNVFILYTMHYIYK